MISNMQATIEGQEAELSRIRTGDEDLKIKVLSMQQAIEKEPVGLSRSKTEEGAIRANIPSFEVTIKRL